MSAKGWIKLHRKINECWIWDEKPFDRGRAWIDLLLLANHSDKKILFNGNVVMVKKGQYLTSIRKLSERWGWSYDKVSRFLKILVSEDMLQKESDSSRTLLTIVNYEVYQDVPNTDECTENTDTSEQFEHPQVNYPNTDRTPTSDKQELKELIKNDKECNKNEGEYTHTHEEVDFEKIWQYTYEAYPKKSNHASAKTEWMNKLLPVVEQNRKEVSKIIWKAVKLFVADYTEKNPDDTAYRYIPTFNKWMTEDLDYWMAEVERRDKE